jgi:hypothetical protein
VVLVRFYLHTCVVFVWGPPHRFIFRDPNVRHCLNGSNISILLQTKRIYYLTEMFTVEIFYSTEMFYGGDAKRYSYILWGIVFFITAVLNFIQQR